MIYNLSGLARFITFVRIGKPFRESPLRRTDLIALHAQSVQAQKMTSQHPPTHQLSNQIFSSALSLELPTSATALENV